MIKVEFHLPVVTRKYDEFEDADYKFIYGISSFIGEANLHSMNDFDLLYDKHENGYFFEVETMLNFKSKKDSALYLEDILEDFTKWMKKNHYDTDYEMSQYDIFTTGFDDVIYDSIPEAYAAFKLLVKGYGALYGA